MRTVTRLSLALTLAAGLATAQRHGGFTGGGRPGGGRPGGGHSGIGHGGVSHSRSFGPRLGGHGFFIGFRSYSHFGWPLTTSFNYWPLYNSFYSPYYTGYSVYPYAPPNVTVVYGPQVEPAVVSLPATIPVYVAPRLTARDTASARGETAEGPALESPPSEPPIYLIAFQDQIIRPALAYWVDGDTLNYITLDRERKQVPLAAVDRHLSSRLNRERRVPFRLPE